MIGNFYPPWVYPNHGEIVKAFRPMRTSLIFVTYDFNNHCWMDSKSRVVEIYGWIKK